MRLRKFIASLCVFGLYAVPIPSSAAIIGFEFSAEVTSTFGIPSVAAGDIVKGFFSVDTLATNIGTASQALYPQPSGTAFKFSTASFVQDFAQVGRVEINDDANGFDRYLACAQRPIGSVDVEDACVYFLGADLNAITSILDLLPPTNIADFSLIALDYRLFNEEGEIVSFFRANPLAIQLVPEPGNAVLFLTAAACLIGNRRRLAVSHGHL